MTNKPKAKERIKGEKNIHSHKTSLKATDPKSHGNIAQKANYYYFQTELM